MPIYEPQEDSYLMKKHVEEHAYGKVLDMGTGTGIQALTAADFAEEVVAVDINPDAIEHVKRTVDNCGIKNITVLHSNLFAKVNKKFNTIVFNPPYLPKDPQVIDIALDGGENGYEVIERFLEQAGKYLAKEGHILLLFSSLTNKIAVDSLIDRHGFKFKQIGNDQIDFEELFVYRLWNKKDTPITRKDYNWRIQEKLNSEKRKIARRIEREEDRQMAVELAKKQKEQERKKKELERKRLKARKEAQRKREAAVRQKLMERKRSEQERKKMKLLAERKKKEIAKQKLKEKKQKDIERKKKNRELVKARIQKERERKRKAVERKRALAARKRAMDSKRKQARALKSRVVKKNIRQKRTQKPIRKRSAGKKPVKKKTVKKASTARKQASKPVKKSAKKSTAVKKKNSKGLKKLFRM
ncbi:methyltransferase [Candidatus Woesearchaeota archaeon]|nr:methyltransferase [Candidatus Woesearchaeota archaeon]